MKAGDGGNATGTPVRKRRARETAVQLIGFAVGIWLIVWCARKALADGGAESIRQHVAVAPWWLLAALLGTTLVSLLCNGALFWALLRPVRPLPQHELQAINLLASFLNYTPLPFRMGLVARFAYHWRVNRMPTSLIAAWFGAAMVSVAVAFLSVALGLPFATQVGLGGVAMIALVASAVGVIMVGWLARRAFVVRWMKGNERMLSDPRAFGLATAFRLIDVAAWSARMACAVAILDIPITTTQAAFLGVTAVIASMNPLGRFGFREAAVVWVASEIFQGSMSAEDVTATFAQLALLESAAEGMVTIPLGSIAAWWCWNRFRNAGPRHPGDHDMPR